MVAEGTILAGANPLQDQLALFLLQALLIIIFARVLGVILSYLGQPTVIAEVIGGILLGPSALGQVTAFKDAMFPKSSLPLLSLVANVGLILFLFIVGLELDPTELVQNSLQSLSISLSGIIVPFGVSVVVSKVLYDYVMVPEVPVGKIPPFSSFLVFTGVAMSITAFPVLARILAERKLLGAKVGKVTLTAAAVDDATAWCLLVLVVALINNPANSIMALYVFLVTVAWGLFLWFAIRPIFRYLIDRSPTSDTISHFAVVFTFLAVWVSSWFTQVIGVHAIFGAFLVGLCVPHKHGFAIKLTEKVEDLVGIVFLPLYFAYSGLNTRIDQLNDGFSWLMVLLVTAVACVGKVLGCGLSGRLSGLSWRESWAVGILMNTKGLVELIVLNLGLQAGVISVKVFTIMVMMALITTFSTVPIISLVYPLKYYSKELNKKEKIDREEEEYATLRRVKKEVQLSMFLTGIECVPSMITVVKMVKEGFVRSHLTVDTNEVLNGLQVSAVRVVPLTERTSAVMKAAEAVHPETIAQDSVLRIFKTFGLLNNLHIITDLIVCLVGSVGDAVIDKVEEFSSSSSEDENGLNIVMIPVVLEKKGPSSISWQSGFSENVFREDARGLQSVVEKVGCTICVFLDRGFSEGGFDLSGPKSDHDQKSIQGRSKRTVCLVFNGGVDDREAAHFVSLFANVMHIHVLRIRAGDLSDIKSLHKSSAAASTNEKTEFEVLTDVDISNSEEAKDELALEDLRKGDLVIEELNAPTVFSVASQSSSGPSHFNQAQLGGMVKAQVNLLKQNLQILADGDLLVIGRRTYETLGNAGLKAWVESDACLASASIIRGPKGKN
ncbi:K(+)/H(+) antiporter [Nowakowskiella sp. JEL0407]|nr:K(+)/H(+) antiporter [Nowakowskiella sp. JEL0407]